MNDEPALDMQNVATSLAPVAVFGYVGSGQAGVGGIAAPIRSSFPIVPGPVGKQGRIGSVEQHAC